MTELNKIRLSPTMLAQMYGNTLVDLKQQPKPAKEIKYLGNNASDIAILVHNTDHIFLPEDQLSFLTRILGACKLNIGDVAIVNTFNYSDTQNILDTLQPSKIILFGINASTSIDTISAPPINSLLGETPEAKLLKSKLWGELKQMFGV